jgi:hypothetical protein
MQGAYPDAALMEKLVALARELGRFPVYCEITMKARNDKTFPYGKTYQRLGSKQQLAEKLQAYCKASEGYEDVAAMCAGDAGSVCRLWRG